ncbi:MAG: transposase [Nocardioides sp.]|nr:transposase [Nocardioides sp.]
MTAMITLADPAGLRAHDAYHRFVRDGAWTMSGLWRVLACHAITRFAAEGEVSLDCDDTLFHKAGRQVEGAGIFRDTVRSTLGRVVYALGLNLVVVTLRVQPPWGGQPIALPVNARLHRKKDTTTTVEHAAAMIAELAAWLPERCFHLCADGAYASLCGAELPRTEVTSRIRRDAALFEHAPPRTRKRGRPRTKGERLPAPPELANAAPANHWHHVQVDVRGRAIERLVLVGDVLWYHVNKHDPVRLVTVGDPDGVEPDDFFVTTDLSATGAQTASRYAGRWSIEVCFATSNKTSTAKNHSPGNTKGPNAQPASHRGSTP